MKHKMTHEQFAEFCLGKGIVIEKITRTYIHVDEVPIKPLQCACGEQIDPEWARNHDGKCGRCCAINGNTLPPINGQKVDIDLVYESPYVVGERTTLREAVLRGNRVEAIKIVRAVYNTGLMEAKKYVVDHYWEQLVKTANTPKVV